MTGVKSDKGVKVLPLDGLTVLNTRAALQGEKLTHLLKQRGAVVKELPLLEIVFPLTGDRLQNELLTLTPTDWIVFTSANGVRAFAGRKTFPCSVAVLGEGTARAATEFGFPRPDFISSQRFSEGFAHEFSTFVSGRTGDLLLCRGDLAEANLPRLLRERTAFEVRELVVYEARLPEAAFAQAAHLLQPPLDVLLCSSAQTVRNLRTVAEACGALPALLALPLCVIGPKTAKAAREAGFTVINIAEEYLIESVVDAVCRSELARRG